MKVRWGGNDWANTEIAKLVAGQEIQELICSGSGLLQPLNSKPKIKNIIVFDIESKDVPRGEDGGLLPYVDIPIPGQKCLANEEVLFDRFFTDEYGNNQHEGFARATHIGIYAGTKYIAFKNDPYFKDELNKYEPEDRAIKPGGCIDRFMRHVTGDNLSYRSHVAEWYGHNAGRFDSIFILTWLIDHNSEFESLITSVHGRIQQIVCWKKKKYKYIGKDGKPHDAQTWTFRDSALILPMSLAEACKTFNAGGVQKQKDFDRNMHEDDPRWYEYNRDDCRGLYGALITYRTMLAGIGGEIGMTAPSTSMKLFRRKFLKASIGIHRHFPDCDGKCKRKGYGKDKTSCSRLKHCDGTCHGCLHDWIRRGYFGGRTEIFNRYAPKGIYYFDINSSYPASMLEAMPAGDAKIVIGFEKYKKYHERLSRNHIGFVECTVFIPQECQIPPLPALKDGKLKFETGYIKGVFEYDELNLIFDEHVNGHIVDVVKSVWYKKRYIFKDFVEVLYGFRKSHIKNDKYGQEGQPEYLDKEGYSKALSELAKLLMNSLYGKFAMNEEREELVLFDPNGPGDWPKGEPLDGQPETCPIWKLPRFIEPRYIIPQISHRITSLSRARLWRALRDITYPPRSSTRKKPGVLYYTDTDSIMSNVDMAKHIEFDVAGKYDYKLGAWKREHPGKVLSGEFVLPKNYALKLYDEATGEQTNDIIRMKGILRSSLTMENFEKTRDGGVVNFERVAQHRTIIRKKWNSPRLVKASKTIRTVYDKRVMAKDGSTTPIFNAFPLE